jgi:hypothetical protein
VGVTSASSQLFKGTEFENTNDQEKQPLCTHMAALKEEDAIPDMRQGETDRRGVVL